MMTRAIDPAQILAGLDRKRDRRRRTLGAVGLIAAIPIGLIAWKVGKHGLASTYLGARGYSVAWQARRVDWQHGGATSAEVAPLVIGFVSGDRSPGDTRFLTWLHRLDRLDLTRLESLRDEELTCLVDLPGLIELNLDQRQANQWFKRQEIRPTDAFLPSIAGLQQLRDLNLGGTRITDAGLVHLTGLTELRMLDLGDTGISDAGLIPLAGLKNLSYLGLRGTRVTPEGAARIKASLPETDVDHESIPTTR